MYKINSDNYATQVFDLGKPIKGAAEWFHDNGKAYLYFATDTELHRKELPGLSNWNDVDADTAWPKTNLTSADWHTMAESGGSLLFANGSNIGLVGYDQSYTNEALNLIPGNTSKTILERNGRAIIGTFPTGNPTAGVNSAIDAEFPLAQIGENGEVYFSDMNSSTASKRFPGGGTTNPGGVTSLTTANFFEWEQTALTWIDKQSLKGMAHFGVYDAESGYNGIYSYGRKVKNQPFAMNLEYALEVDEIGAIIHNNGFMYASYRDGADFGVKYSDPTLKATGEYYGLDFKSPIKNPEQPTTWLYAEAFMKALPTGCSVELRYRANKNGAFITTNVADGSSTYTTVGGKKATFRIAAEGDIFEPALILTPYQNTTPEIYRLRVYFN